MSDLEEQSVLATDRSKGTEEGLKLGKAEGIELGKAEGIELGTKKTNIKIAKKLLELGIPIEKISLATNLTKAEIEKLK